MTSADAEMAIYIQIRKAREDTSAVVYTFGPSEGLVGTVMLKKGSGDIEVVDIEGNRNPQWYLPRLRSLLAQHHAAGAYPDFAEYTA